jgi:hypothetical protein
MQYITKLKLASIHQLMDAENKSTEYMIQYMQDVCKVDNNCVMTYMRLSTEVKKKLMNEVNEFLEFFTLLD